MYSCSKLENGPWDDVRQSLQITQSHILLSAMLQTSEPLEVKEKLIILLWNKYFPDALVLWLLFLLFIAAAGLAMWAGRSTDWLQRKMS